jgi:FMNH2-dependent dimethyl sulfone monooxygenase
MRYGYWLPVFGGWLRNVPDEGMEASWRYVQRLAAASEEIGYDLTLVAELFLNDIKGIEAPSLDAWSTAAALAAVTERLELMVAVRPTFHQPAILAKQAANIDHISGGRLSLNVVSSWWADEARRYGVRFDAHDDRYARTEEWLEVLDGAWREPAFRFKGRLYEVDETVLAPKPVRRPRPTIYAGGESEAAKSLISRRCDAYVMHGDPPERVAPKVADMRRRRDEASAAAGAELAPMQFGVAAYASCATPRPRRGARWRASRTWRPARRGTATTRTGCRTRSSSSRSRSRTTRCRTAGCGRASWGRPSRWPTGCARSRRRGWTCCCCSAARSSRRWSASPSR